MLENIDFHGGKVLFNYFYKINSESTLQEDDFYLSEDMLAVSYMDGQYILDAGWSGDENNRAFVIRIVMDNDWVSPFKEYKTLDKREVEKVIKEFIKEITKRI